MAIRGDYSALRTMADRIGTVGGAGGVDKLRKNLAATALKLIADEFRGQKDPYGQSWRPLSPSTVAGRRKGKKKGGAKILQSTGRLRASFGTTSKGLGFVVSSKVKYAPHHQYGAKLKRRNAGIRGLLQRKRVVGAIPRRMMVPDSKQGLGPIWKKAFEKTATRVLVSLKP